MAVAMILSLPLLVLMPSLGGAALLLLPLLWACFLLADTVLVSAWRSGLLHHWRVGALNLGMFAEAIATLPTPTKASTNSMLRRLPVLSSLRDRDLEVDVRTAVAAFTVWRWTEETAAALLPSVLLAIPSAYGAVLLMTATPLTPGEVTVVTVLVGIVVAMRFGLSLRGKQRLVRALAQMMPERRTSVLMIARDLDWSGTSDSKRIRMLRTLERTCNAPARDTAKSG